MVGCRGIACVGRTGGPQWTVTAVSGPTNFAPGDESGDDIYRVTVKKRVGPQRSPVTVTDVLPEGLTLARAGSKDLRCWAQSASGIGYSVELRRRKLRIRRGSGLEEALVLTVPVDVELVAAPTVDNVVRVSGGGAPDATMETPTVISSKEASFGIAPGSTTATLSTTQAGAHADLTTSIGFKTTDDKGTLAGAPRETVVDLPAGFAGDLVDTPTCTVALFSQEECPIGTQVGVTTLTLNGRTRCSPCRRIIWHRSVAMSQSLGSPHSYSTFRAMLVSPESGSPSGEYRLRARFRASRRRGPSSIVCR